MRELFYMFVVYKLKTILRIVGFLLGFSLASSFAAYHLLEEYKQASAALQASVLELQASTEKVRLTVCCLGSRSLIIAYRSRRMCGG